MKKINIKFMHDETLAIIKNNPQRYSEIINANLESNEWIIQEFKTPYVDKKITINDFELTNKDKLNKSELSEKVSEILYDTLHELPAYILSDERFWAWINFDKGYQLSHTLMPINEKSTTLVGHYFFTGGTRRGLFFGVYSRLFYRALLTRNDHLGDPYELTKYVNEKPSRIRNLTWRTYSNNIELVKTIIEIQYKYELKYGDKITNKVYEEVAKYISQLGSTTYVDILSKEDLEKLITSKIDFIINQENNI